MLPGLHHDRRATRGRPAGPTQCHARHTPRGAPAHPRAPAARSMREETRRRVAGFIEHPITDGAVMVLILVSIILLFAEVAVGSPLLQERLRLINETIIFLFIIELGLRFTAETKRSRFFRDYWIDILS